jgi:flagellar biosynthetic protein FliR
MIVSPTQLLIFMLIMARIIGLFLTAPLLSYRTISKTAKIGLIIWITTVLWFNVPVPPVATGVPQAMVPLIIALVQEVLIGLMLGTVAALIFAGIQAAGEIIDMQMGLSVASTFDPSQGGQASVVARFFSEIMLVLFLAIDGHHLLLVALRKSYEVLPMLQVWNFGLTGRTLAELGGSVFAVGISLAAPIVLVIFLLDFAFGMVSRVAPQVNVFMLGFQCKPPLGEAVLLLTAPLLVERMLFLLSRVVEEMTMFFYTMRV